MRARFILFLLAAALLLAPRVAAGAAVVPDHFATVAAAIASGADTVLVRDGTYDEAVTVARPLVLARFDPGGPPASRPRLTALDFVAGVRGGWARVTGLAVAQVVHVGYAFDFGPDVWLQGCTLDAGLAGGPSLAPRVRLEDCAIGGAVEVRAWSVLVTGNTVTNGLLNVDYEDFGTLTGNTLTNAPGTAITLRDNDGYGIVSDNVITDSGAGIYIDFPGGTRIERNRVEHCFGTGIAIDPAQGLSAVHLADNVLRDLGGDGISFGTLGGTALGNTIERVALAGIRLAPVASGPWRVAGNRITDTGMAGVFGPAGAYVGVLARNTILRCGGGGAELWYADRVDSNVVGRCRSDGIRVDATVGGIVATHNTLYLNGESGLRVTSTHDGVVAANIGYGNGLYALDWAGGGVATLACNLGFGNRAGIVRGAEPSDTDRDGDPLFCDLPADDVHIAPGSAALSAGCETAGALGPGCGQPAGVGGFTAASALRAWPQPARTSVHFEWPAGAAVRLEVFDTRGARCWRHDAPAAASGATWNLRDGAGGRLPSGVYFVRVSAEGRSATARFVVAP